MSGRGGWYRWNKKDTVEEHCGLDVRYLHRKGILTFGFHSISWKRGERRTGSIGYWAGKIRSRFYAAGKYFACRHCYDLTYRSCQESDSRFSRFFRNYDSLGGLENMPLWALKGCLSRAWKEEERPSLRTGMLAVVNEIRYI